MLKKALILTTAIAFTVGILPAMAAPVGVSGQTAVVKQADTQFVKAKKKKKKPEAQLTKAKKKKKKPEAQLTKAKKKKKKAAPSAA